MTHSLPYLKYHQIEVGETYYFSVPEPLNNAGEFIARVLKKHVFDDVGYHSKLYKVLVDNPPLGIYVWIAEEDEYGRITQKSMVRYVT